MTVEAIVDCEEGRRQGCATFCCHLIVRYGPDDPPVYDADGNLKSCVDKDPASGRCVSLDPQTHRCLIWDSRPSVCRGYDCRHDPLLPVVLRDGFVSLVRLVTARPAT